MIVSKDIRKLGYNFIFLSLLQVFNYIFPLLLLPYLSSVIGLERFGLILFSQAFISYFNILIDYGFNLSATREISINRDNKKKVAEIFSSVMVIKFGFLILSFLILSFIVFTFEKFSNNMEIYYLTFIGCIGQALFPIWYFQGMENFRYITVLNIIIKLFVVAIIFVFVRDSDDYMLVPIFNSSGWLFIGFFSLYIANKELNLLVNHKVIKIIIYLKSGYSIFFSSLLTSFYRILPATLLGFMSTNERVAIYSIAEKLIRAIISMNQPFINSFFPYISKKFDIDKKNAFRINRLVLKFTIPLILFIMLFLYLTSQYIISMFFNDNSSEAITIFYIFIPLIFIVFVANMYGSQTMLHIGLEKEFRDSIMYGAIYSLIFLPLMILYYNEIGAAVSVVISEFIIMISFIYFVRRNVGKVK